MDRGVDWGGGGADAMVMVGRSGPALDVRSTTLTAYLDEEPIPYGDASSPTSWLHHHVVRREVHWALAQAARAGRRDHHRVAEDGHAPLTLAPHVRLDDEGIAFLERPRRHLRIVRREGYEGPFIAQAAAVQNEPCSPSSNARSGCARLQ